MCLASRNTGQPSMWCMHAVLAVTQEAEAQGSHIVRSPQDTLASRPGTTTQLAENMRFLTIVSQHRKRKNIDAPRVFFFFFVSFKR